MANILAQQDLFLESFVQECADQLHDLRLTGALKRREAHPQKVGLNMCATAHDLAPMFDTWMRVAVANHNARRVEPFIFKNGELREANIALHRVGGD